MASKDRASTAKSGQSEARREKLLDIQKREQLKGLLINKFKVKYGDKGASLAKYIDNEVQRFLKNDRLTEDNLKRLDERILKESELRDKKDAILDDHKSQKSAPKRALSQKSDARSVSSHMSGASGPGKKAAAAPKGDNFDTQSWRSGSQAPKTEVFSELDEDDEWTAIQKFNTLLHYEEQKQTMLRDKERKRLIKQELDKQLQEKNSRKKAEFDEKR